MEKNAISVQLRSAQSTWGDNPMKPQPIRMLIDDLVEDISFKDSIVEIDTRQSRSNPTSLMAKMSKLQSKADRDGVRVDFEVSNAVMGFMELSGCRSAIHNVKALK